MSLHPLVLYLTSNTLDIPPPLIASSLLKILDTPALTFIFKLLTAKVNIGNLQNTKQNAEILKTLKNLKILEREGKYIKLCSNIDKFICVKEWNRWIGSEVELVYDQKSAQKYEIEESVRENKCKIYQAKYKAAPKHYNVDSQTFTNFEYFEDLLNLIVNKKGDFPCKNVRKILFEAEIIDHHLEITNKGFEFLLKTRTGQLWELLLTVLKICKSNRNEMIEILLELSLLKEGVYVVKKIEDNFFGYLEKLGLINIHQACLNEKEKNESVEGYNYEAYISEGNDINVEFNNDKVTQNNNTKMVIQINHLFTLLFLQEERVKLDFLIIESNFRLYLKTSQPYHISILSLFTQTIHSLPNFIVSIITEESISRAFDKGITGNQLYKYLRSIAQEIPENVIEQIFIWQDKRDRITTNQCVMFSGFLSITDFKKTVDFCKNKVEYNEEKRMLFVKEEDVEEIKKYIKANQM